MSISRSLRYAFGCLMISKVVNRLTPPRNHEKQVLGGIGDDEGKIWDISAIIYSKLPFEMRLTEGSLAWLET